MTTALDVLGVGANSIDTVTLVPGVPHLRGPNAKMRVSRVVRSCGGQTATALATCAGFGLRSAYVGPVGFAECDEITQALEARGVAADLHARTVPNQFAIIVIDETSGERIVLWGRDDQLRLTDGEIPWEHVASARAVHVDDVDEDMAVKVASFARARGVLVTSDLDRATERTEALVAAVSVPVFAEHLTQQLTGEADQERALRKLRRLNPGVLVVTLGAEGAIALEGDRLHVEPGVPVEAVDTTGAGDVFRGAAIVGLLAGWSVPRMLRLANATAARACTRLGALAGAPTAEDAASLLAGVPAD